jgi:hypothetical protein
MKKRNTVIVSGLIIFLIVTITTAIFRMEDDPTNSTTKTTHANIAISDLINEGYIKEHLKSGMMKEEVIQFFGSQYIEFPYAETNSIMWRFDFPGKEGYTFNPAAIGRSQSEIDMKGLTSGDMKAQIVIEFSDNQLSRFVAYYQSNGKVKEYRLLSDGTLREK